MMYVPNYIRLLKLSLFVMATLFTTVIAADDEQKIDYLSFEQGAIPVAIDAAASLKVGMEHALLAIDGDTAGFVLTRKPGSADTKVTFIFKLPALTTFSDFSVPDIFETPSPSQTFVSNIEIAGSDQGVEGPFQVLAVGSLKTHAKKEQVTAFQASAEIPVKWVRVTLSGGIDILRDKTFFEFSEIIGHGRQESVPLLKSFTGKWKGRGVLLELKQDDVSVSGCYDREGDLTGTVSGNLLRATGKTRRAGIPSVFLLTLTADGGVMGVRSTNGAPFRLYTGAEAPGIKTQCSEQTVPSFGCGSIIHGIQFDYDSASIRPSSQALLDALSVGLKTVKGSAVSVIGHTSSEGSNTYNEQLSQRRAEAVVAALVSRGIDGLTAKGFGEKQPIADNATGAGRSLNRRVEIVCR